MERRLNLRFKRGLSADDRAWDYLQSIDRQECGTLNSFIITTINAYSDMERRRNLETDLISKVVEAVRNELRSIPVLICPTNPNVEASFKPKNEGLTEDDEDAIMDFLDNL